MILSLPPKLVEKLVWVPVSYFTDNSDVQKLFDFHWSKTPQAHKIVSSRGLLPLIPCILSRHNGQPYGINNISC
jgi:hemin uptake protein HemP